MKATIEKDGVIINVIEIPDDANHSDFGTREYLTTDNISDSVMQSEYARQRQSERTKVFSITIDKLNPIWYNSLTSTQQSNLATWRQQWLDYPSTGTIPNEALVQDIF